MPQVLATGRAIAMIAVPTYARFKAAPDRRPYYVQWRKDHRTHVNAYNKKWRKANRKRVRAYARRRAKTPAGRAKSRIACRRHYLKKKRKQLLNVLRAIIGVKERNV
jgi:hypothetical protein